MGTYFCQLLGMHYSTGCWLILWYTIQAVWNSASEKHGLRRSSINHMDSLTARERWWSVVPGVKLGSADSWTEDSGKRRSCRKGVHLKSPSKHASGEKFLPNLLGLHYGFKVDQSMLGGGLYEAFMWKEESFRIRLLALKSWQCITHAEFSRSLDNFSKCGQLHLKIFLAAIANHFCWIWGIQ